MTALSVNINKIATLRNARGGNNPCPITTAQEIEIFGAQGITVHPRPDERHITRNDVFELKKVVKGEFNIEGYPSDDFLKLIKEIKPTQVTLVPDPPHVLTSNNGWDCIKNESFLSEVVNELNSYGCRISLFLNPEVAQVAYAKKCGAHRIELYTEMYASNYEMSKESAIEPYIAAATEAKKIGIGVNAGHDLSLDNLGFFAQQIPNLLEVSIGHALIADALKYGMNNTVQMYLNSLVRS